jgi:hypothetical protein
MREGLTGVATTGDAASTFKQWGKGIRIAQIAHLRAAAYYQRMHQLLGIPVTVLTAVVGTSIFASMGESEKNALLIAAGIISALAAILSGVQTFLNFSELAVKHQLAGTKYGKLRRRVDEIMAVGYTADGFEALLHEVREEWNRIEEESPTVAQRYIDSAMAAVGSHSATSSSSTA